MAHVATDPLAPPTEQDNETGKDKHERDVDRSGQQVVLRRQQRDKPEDDASGQKQADELGTRDEGGRVLLPVTAASQ